MSCYVTFWSLIRMRNVWCRPNSTFLGFFLFFFLTAYTGRGDVWGSAKLARCSRFGDSFAGMLRSIFFFSSQAMPEACLGVELIHLDICHGGLSFASFFHPYPLDFSVL